MKKHLELTTDRMRRNMILAKGQSANLPEDARLDPAGRFGIEQQNAADYLALSDTCARIGKSIGRIRSEYDEEMRKAILAEDFRRLRDVSRSQNTHILSSPSGTLRHAKLSRNRELLKVEKKEECFSLFEKNGVSPEDVARMRSRCARRINRVITPVMTGRGGGSPSPQTRGGGETRGTGYVWDSLYYKRSFFTEILDDGSVYPLQMSLPDQGCVWNYLSFKNHNPGDFDVAAGILQNEIGDVFWMDQGDRITIELDMTCLFADAYIQGDDEFGFSGYHIKLNSNVCASVAGVTKTEPLWDYRDKQGPGITIFDMNLTVEGFPKSGTKNFAFTFGPVPKSTLYTIWVGLRDIYYCFQNDYEVDLLLDNMWTFNEVRITKLV